MRSSTIVPIRRQRPVWRLSLLVAILALALPASANADDASAPGAVGVAWDRAASDGLVTLRRDRSARRARMADARAANPLASLPPYVEPQGPAPAQAHAWSASRPDDAALIRMIAEQPQGWWLGDWSYDVRTRVARRMAQGRQAGAVPVLVAYNIPNRDCGQHSSGGAADAAAYRRWIEGIAQGIGTDPAIVILEPDALAGMDCLPRALRRQRVRMLAAAVERLAALPAAAVYLDAGNPGWIPAARMARRLRAAGVAGARGFAVNVAGFETTARSAAYGREISRRTAGAHFVIDTSRNGAGPLAPGEWCNPSGRALGALPTTDTGDPLIDAFLWVKRPGESDGTCNGGPRAGTWWPEYALGLARRSSV